MYGKNEVTSEFQKDDGSLLVNELFYTIQGEGPDAGRPAVFLRLAKCNLRCFFCDTEFEVGTKYSLKQISTEVLDLVFKNKCKLLVITGGEPLLQNLVPLIALCSWNKIQVSIETAGTTWLDGLDQFFGARVPGRNVLVCSPKTPKIEERLIPLITAYKYIVRTGGVSNEDGLPIQSTQLPGRASEIFRPPAGATVYVQAMDEKDDKINQLNLEMAAAICKMYGYRLSVQMHKLAGLP